jgi:hypothetical protein
MAGEFRRDFGGSGRLPNRSVILLYPWVTEETREKLSV